MSELTVAVLRLALLAPEEELLADAYRIRWQGAVLTIGSWAVFNWGLNLVIPLWPSFLTQ